ncbi:hypothetical protein [Shewanella algae]|uniref:hypothetical protein n=1 Tax=Shewanella algae TaxID=38313 RepID=UPI0031F4E671
MPSKQHKLENLIKRLVLISGKGHLDHNELELALDMLEEAALEATSKPPEEIWVKLKDAAKSMGLEERCEFYNQQIQNS